LFVFYPTIDLFHDLDFKYMLMLFSDIKEEALCVLHRPCNLLKYIEFNEILCEISKSHLLPSILGYFLSYRQVMSETLEKGTRVFNLHLSDCAGDFHLRGSDILNIIM